ncbi:MAG: metallopeptidase TldD-related protein [Pseudomonadota bacterium]|nr:metallopeptidase TldD-related protein [Pseudomonadota bacterium]
MDDARDKFDRLMDELERLCLPGEVFLAGFLGEDSDFVRLNHNRVRQAGHVVQRECRVSLIRGRCEAQGALSLGADRSSDAQRLGALIERLRTQLAVARDDPHFLYATEPHSTAEVRTLNLPDGRAAIETIMGMAEGLDLVGLFANGSFYRGFGNSLGQRNWYANGGFNVDISAHGDGARAVKCLYAGQSWDPAALGHRIAELRDRLAALTREGRPLTPGRYRVYLSPYALGEVLGLLGMSAFGMRSHKTLHTPLLKMIREGRRLHPDITVLEAHGEGYTPTFTSAGFIKPEQVVLIEAGGFRDCLADRRSAAEYGVTPNAEFEGTRSLALAAGDVPEREMLARLDTGIYVDHLWYGNFSDWNDCRITATTRYASFWVEDGEITAPIPTMRLDESIYHLLGDGLMGLTRERESIVDPGTYEWRSLSSQRLPGALVDGVGFAM